MKIFIKDVTIVIITALVVFTIMGWWNAPAYKACAKSHSQEFCYTVLK